MAPEVHSLALRFGPEGRSRLVMGPICKPQVPHGDRSGDLQVAATELWRAKSRPVGRDVRQAARRIADRDGHCEPTLPM